LIFKKIQLGGRSLPLRKYLQSPIGAFVFFERAKLALLSERNTKVKARRAGFVNIMLPLIRIAEGNPFPYGKIF